jgi:hypothetical protein
MDEKKTTELTAVYATDDGQYRYHCSACTNKSNEKMLYCCTMSQMNDINGVRVEFRTYVHYCNRVCQRQHWKKRHKLDHQIKAEQMERKKKAKADKKKKEKEMM